jgi:tetratricopeptide (TPR) repeat protein
MQFTHFSSLTVNYSDQKINKMKRISFLAVTILFSFSVMAQTLEEGIKMLHYGRFAKAEEHFEKLVSANPNDPDAVYWLGQLYLNDIPMKLQEAKELYAKALIATNQNPLIIIGVGHVDLLEGRLEEGKQKFEQALAGTKNKKNKNFGDPALLSAIGRANSLGDSKTGDPEYAIAKLEQAAQLDTKNPNIFVDMGMIHLKRGGGFGGQAKRAFDEAISRDPNYGRPYYKIGKIFESQRNTEMFLEYYNKAVEMDPKFALAYYSLYEYYQNRDVNKAKEYLDKYIANNDQDRETDFFYADYLFRAGKNAESIQKGKEIEASLKQGELYPKVYKLFALNYDRLGDSLKAKENMETYMQQSKPERLTGDDYATMATFYLKFPGMEDKADGQVEKAVILDTVVENQIKYMKELAGAYSKQGNHVGNYKWLKRIDDINPNKTAVTYYYLTDAAFQAGDYAGSAEIGAKYIAAYPDQIQGYSLRRRAAVALDADTLTGSAIPAVDQYIEFLMRDVAANKGRILENHGYKFYYYIIKSREYTKAVQSAKDILAIDPENSYGLDALKEAEKFEKLKAEGKIQ